MTYQFGNVSHPPFVDRLIPDRETMAWDDLGPRRPVGACQHSMLGTLWGTDGYFRRGTKSTGLTDYGIGGSTDGAEWDGVILRWNDPLGKEMAISRGGASGYVSPDRAPWANGGSDGLEGDGPAFVRRLGVAAINRDLVSIERSDGGSVATPMSRKQFESICALTAHWFDRARVPWDQFPLNPAVGIVTHMMHFEFATKGCPFPPVVDRIDEIQNRVRDILRSGQTVAGEVTPSPQPRTPHRPWWPQGYDLDQVRERFGKLTRHREGVPPTDAPFDARGVISNAWIARGVEEQRTVPQLPRAFDWWELEGSNDRQIDVVTFGDGWTLMRPDRYVAWSWVR